MAGAVGPGRAPAGAAARSPRELYARYDEWIAEVVDEGVAAGEFRSRDPRAVVQRLVAAIDGIGLRVLVGDPADRRSRAGARLIVEALAAELDAAPAAFARGGVTR